MHILQKAFGGMIPKLSRAHLPDLNAQKAVNCYLSSGELRAFNYPDPLFKLSPHQIFGGLSKAHKIFQVVDNNGSHTYQAFSDKAASMVRGPLVNDKYNRYYWTAENYPGGGARAISQLWFGRWDGSINEGVPRLAGLPKPPTFTCKGPPNRDPNVSDETRVYVITWYTDLGEESEPSEPVTSIGSPYLPWDLKNLPTHPPANTGVVGIRIYRTITGKSGSASYYYVGETNTFQTTTYRDRLPIRDVALNDILTTFMWNPPPDELRGLLAHPNGFLVGYSGRDIYFSEPYRPHAWPASYVLSVKDNIIGLGLLGNTVMILTDMYPYAASGINPASMTLTKVRQPEPCIGEEGIVSTVFGVYYPSPNGLMLVTPGQVTNVTEKLITRNQWQDYIDQGMTAGVYNTMYIGFTNEYKGFVFSPSEQMAQFTELDGAWTVDTIQNDAMPDRLTFLRNNELFEWNPKLGFPVPYHWKSKEFVAPKPINLGAMRLYYDNVYADDVLPEAVMLEYNKKRMAWQPDVSTGGTVMDRGYLAPIGSTVLGGSQCKDIEHTGPCTDETKNQGLNGVPQIRATIGGSSLFDILNRRQDEAFLNVILWAGCVKEPVFNEDIQTDGMVRLPSGFKDDRWCFEVNGNVDIQTVKFAETGKGLMNV